MGNKRVDEVYFFISGYGEITETRFILPLKIVRKLDQICEITIFIHWTTGNTRKRNEVSHMITLTFCLKTYSTPQKSRETGTGWFPCIRETEIREAEWART